jgi:hypothetical protein
MDTSHVPGLRPGDLEECAQQMARDLIREPLLQRSDPPVRIGLASVENNTHEPFVGESRDMVITRIQTLLWRALKDQCQRAGGTAKFIMMRDTVREEMERQRREKRLGEASHRGLKNRHGVDYLLSGVYHANDKRTGRTRAIEMLMTFDLTDAESGEVVWTHDYLVKTITRK